MLKSIFVLCLFLFANLSYAQQYEQTIRGNVVDNILQKPISGATVRIIGTALGNTCDEKGQFKIEHVPVGIHNLQIQAIGFKQFSINNLSVVAGKENVLNIQLEEQILFKKEVVIKGDRKSTKPLNEMSLVSSRSFSVEEAQRYAAAVNDPARMATNFAGVLAGDDGNNQIVIRGNSPTGLLWRMEGIDIPNPNHFASIGSSGGGISILSAQLLSNSDFTTSAFAAEYGNAMSGVFDLHLRKGNNEKKEYTLQAGLLGINAAAEGPFSKKYAGSYLINYRYSTLSILSKLGINFTPSTTNFQDLSYHFVYPTKRFGEFSLFSFGGLSHQFFNAKKDSSKWLSSSERYSDDFASNTGMWGFKHRIYTSKKSILNTAIGYSIVENNYTRNYTQQDYSTLDIYQQKYKTKRLTISSIFNQKVNSNLLIRSGFSTNFIHFNYTENLRELHSNPIKNVVDAKGQLNTLQLFSQIQYKFSNSLTMNAGLHYFRLGLNNSKAIEPRASIQYLINKKHTLSLGYGKHSQMQALGIYFYQENGILPNRNLDLSKSHHIVLGHQYAIAKYTKLKTEIYYQYAYSIPVSPNYTNTFSVLNIQGDYVREFLSNNGLGRNYGLEFSLERSLFKNFYTMLSTSFYQSKYTPMNNIEYNTRYNGNIILNFVAGKEISSKNNRRTFGVNTKTVYAGGYRTTPIDVMQSQLQQKTVYIQDKAYTEQLPAYFRSDIKLSMKWNRKRFTSTLSLDLQNLTNRLNVFDRFYNVESNSIKTYYQTGFIPILNYKVEF